MRTRTSIYFLPRLAADFGRVLPRLAADFAGAFFLALTGFLAAPFLFAPACSLFAAQIGRAHV
jgi:hypothetical protein